MVLIFFFVKVCVRRNLYQSIIFLYLVYAVEAWGGGAGSCAVEFSMLNALQTRGVGLRLDVLGCTFGTVVFVRPKYLSNHNLNTPMLNLSRCFTTVLYRAVIYWDYLLVAMKQITVSLSLNSV